MIGWKILKDGEYKLPLPSLSIEEEQLLISVEDIFGKESRKKKIGSEKISKEAGFMYYVGKDGYVYKAKLKNFRK